VLLADPTLPLPNRTALESVYDLARALDEIEPGFSGFFPRWVLPDHGDVSLRFEAPADVRATLYRQSTSGGLVSESVVDDGSVTSGTSEITFNDTTGRQNYFLRLENTRGVPVERQVWFRTQ